MCILHDYKNILDMVLYGIVLIDLTWLDIRCLFVLESTAYFLIGR